MVLYCGIINNKNHTQMALLIDLIIENTEAREARDAGQITAEECERRIDAARAEFRRKEEEAWQQQSRDIANFLSNCKPVPEELAQAIAGKSADDAEQIMKGYERLGSAFLSLIGTDTNALWKSYWAGK